MMQDIELKTARDLIYLVSCAVNEESPAPETCAAMDLAEVFRLARRHSLTVAAALALERTVDLPPYFKEEKFKRIRVLSLYDIERKRVLEALDHQQIRYLPLKGIVLRRLYPQTVMREMSDNDVLCDRDRMPEVKNIMERLGYTCKSYDVYHHDSYKKGGLLEFEMHRTLFLRSQHPEWYEYYEQLWERLLPVEAGSCRLRMTDEDVYIFLLCHLRKHYEMSGTGLRSLLDVYLFNQRYGGSLRSEYLRAEFEKLGLCGFARDIGQLAERVFSRQRLSEDEERELLFFLGSNTHGTAENRMMQQLQNDDSLKSKSRYLLKRVFPNDAVTRKKHPVVFRYKVLYPFWVVYRPLEAVIRKPKQTVRKFKRLKNFKTKENRGMYHE